MSIPGQEEAMTQCEAVIRWLETHDSISDTEARDELGIRRLASRIGDLKEMGEPVTSTLYPVKNRDGKTCYVARYSMIKGQMVLGI